MRRAGAPQGFFARNSVVAVRSSRGARSLLSTRFSGGWMSTDVMIYTNDLSKNFGSFRAVDKINFEVRRGEVVGFLGPNGAGKSTTMRILTCFISPTAGTARVNKFDVFDEPLKVRESLG